MTSSTDTAFLEEIAPTPASRRHAGITVLFALTSFTGAALLFVVQPMVARLVLPSFGGSASVWSTSSLFFQFLLLFGYLYVHVSTRRLGARQPLLHLGLLLLPLVLLPIALPADSAPDGTIGPALWLLWVLLLMIGLPFAVISTTGPLLQRWYSWTGAARSEDPYFLFATSNLGSFGGLLAYPFLVEPLLSLHEQRITWSVGFVCFALLMAVCGVVALRQSTQGQSTQGQGTQGQGTRTNDTPSPLSRPDQPALPDEHRRPPARTVLLWLGLAFLPSTLMLGVTAHISTDVAAIPLMWVVPLAIYLATFVIAFARAGRGPTPRATAAAVCLAVVACILYVIPGGSLPLWLLLTVDLGLLAAAAYAAHAKLAATRPDTSMLTQFYLVVAAGGALGGLLNGLVAPMFFTWVWEYPLALLGVLLLGLSTQRSVPAMLGRYRPSLVLAMEVALVLALLLVGGAAGGKWQEQGGALGVAGLGLWLLVGLVGARRPAAMAVAVALTLLGTTLLGPEALYQNRTFYGSYRVTVAEGQHVFSHGTTVHGSQYMDSRSTEPTSYYSRSGPVGDVLATDAPQHIAVVGLGVGTMAAHVGAGQKMTFFEIDEEVVRVASDPDLFTYLSDSEATIDTIVGDGRLALADVAPDSFDMLVLDAFSSDAIPVHLLTEEAFDVYSRTLAPDGVLLVHISNRVFDLEPVVASHAARLGWQAAVGEGRTTEDGALSSTWVMLSPDPARVAQMEPLPGWRPVGPERRAWTDDFSSVLTVLAH